MKTYINAEQTQDIKDTMNVIFAMPERDQPAAWEDMIEFMDGVINKKGAHRKAAIQTQEIFKSVAREAKYFA